MATATAPYDQRDGFIWLNGKLIPWGDARLHVLTHGLHYASAVFEGMRAYDGEIFKLSEHNQRLHRSATLLDFAIPYSVAELDKAAREVVRVNMQKNEAAKTTFIASMSHELRKCWTTQQPPVGRFANQR